MEQTQFYPYPETQISLSENALEVHCPWIKLKFRTLAENQKRIELALREIQEGKNHPSTQWLISHFSQYPVAKTLPRLSLVPSESEGLVSLISSQRKIAQLSYCELLQFIGLNSEQKPSDQSEFRWNAQDVLTQSQIVENSFDPLTIYTLCRRLRLVDESAASSNSQWYTRLGELLQRNEEAFFYMAKVAMRQTHFVTQQCVPCLTPALQSFVEARLEVTEFMQEEKGHDYLVLKSLKELGVQNLEGVEVFAETLYSMHCLRAAAEYCPLGFACLIGIFEGTSYAAKDPMAALLEQSSLPQAAKGLQTHFLINRDHNHSNVGFELASKLGSVSREHAVAAIRFSEMTVRLGNQLTERLQNLITTSMRESYVVS